MDVNIRDLAVFTIRLNELYQSFQGTARLQEPYADGYLEFSADSFGHIQIHGCIQQWNTYGYTQKLFFGNEFDQTYLKEFVKELFAKFAKYSKH